MGPELRNGVPVVPDSPPQDPSPPRGLEFGRTFSAGPPISWIGLTARVRDESGRVLFEQPGFRVPASWSQRAADVVAEKYAYGERGTPQRESGVDDIAGRVVGQVEAWGRARGVFASDGDSAAFAAELGALCLGQYGAFNSPVWFNLGLYRSRGVRGPANGWRWSNSIAAPVRAEDSYQSPQISACFIQSVTDDMEGIMALATSEAMLFKYGSGTGTDLSPLRSTREKLSGGGKPSGPVSFMRIYDAGAGVVKSGGKSRRAAKMQTLKCHHPDILEYVGCKAREDRKARALIAAGYSAEMTGHPDEAYSSVAFQNANLSVRATDAFMAKAAGDDPNPLYPLMAVTTGRAVDEANAGEVLDKIAEGTWACGDPGMQFEDTVNRWHTCPAAAPINSSNPCSEYMFIDDSACNLASLALPRFLGPDGSFAVARFRAAVRTFIVAQEILVDPAGYPTEAICRNSHRFRPLGLGHCGLGHLLMSAGLAYDSAAGRSLAGAITALMTAEAYLTSADLARTLGPFEGFAENREPMLRVIAMHRDACRAARNDAYLASPDDAAEGLWAEATAAWDEALDAGERLGYRIAQVTLLAPCGTIAFMMDLGHSTGIEPALGLRVTKKMAGGGVIEIVNPAVPAALAALGYEAAHADAILGRLEAGEAMEDIAGPGPGLLDPEDLPVFDCAFPARPGGRAIAPSGHIGMVAAVQPFLSGAVSKTVNLPESAAAADIRAAYVEAWRRGLKAVAIYRDNSKGVQPVSVSAAPRAEGMISAGPEGIRGTFVLPRVEPFRFSAAPQAEDVGPGSAPAPNAPPRRERLPDTRESLTHKFSIDGHEGYVTVGFYPDGRPGELFVEMAKEGSTVGGLMDVIGTLTSLILQHGIPLDVLVRKFSHGSFAPAGITRNPEIRFASSITDYVFRWLGLRFPGAGPSPRREPHEIRREPAPLGFPLPPVSGGAPDGPAARWTGQVCCSCGSSALVRTGTCSACMNCGTSQGCS